MIDSALDAPRRMLLRLMTAALSIGLALTGILAAFDPDFMRPVVLATAAASTAVAIFFFIAPNLPPLVLRVYLVVVSVIILLTALTIQPFPLGVLSGFVFLGIAVGVASYEKFGLAIGLGATAIAFGVIAVGARSTVPFAASVILVSVAVVCLVAVLGYRQTAERATQAALRDATHDDLTGLTNRRGMSVGVRLLTAVAERNDFTLGCLIMDLDNFKSVNDRFGHSVGDQVLTRAAHTLREGTRDGDLLVRLGGEEFALFTLVTSEVELHAIAERLRRAVESTESGAVVTISIGASVALSTDAPNAKDVMERADRAMYRAKKSGRNLVVVN